MDRRRNMGSRVYARREVVLPRSRVLSSGLIPWRAPSLPSLSLCTTGAIPQLTNIRASGRQILLRCDDELGIFIR